MQVHQLSAVQLRDALDRGELSSVEIVDALHARTDAVDGALNAYVHQFRDEARAAAAEADRARSAGEPLGPLHGLPMTIKENLATAGLPQTMGIVARQAVLAERDAVLVTAAKQAGAIVLGKTNVPLLLLSMETHNDIWGTSYNPWNTGRVPGGSSGGEGAAIASGQSPWGIGTDIGGSIRIPCAWCGIPGLKPTVGRWSMVGSAGGQPGQEVVKAQSGPMARTVADLVLLMQALSPEVQHRLDPRVPPVPFDDPAAVDLSGLRVGVYENDGVFMPAAAVRRAVREAADALRSAGAEVVPYEPPRSWDMVAAYFGAVTADGARTALDLLAGQPPTVQLGLLTTLAGLPGPVRAAVAAVMGLRGDTRRQRLLRAFGRKDTTELWALAVRRVELQAAELAAWDAVGLDVVVGPPTVTPAALPDQTGDWSLGAWHTMRWNVLDLPAGVVPVSRVRDDEQRREELGDRLDKKAATFEAGSVGLPVCAQVIGRPWREDLVLATMSAIEAALGDRPDFPRTPVDPAPAPAAPPDR